MCCCPRDGELLASNDVCDYRYYSCQRCSGIWIPGRAINSALSAEGAASLLALPSHENEQVNCPDCRRGCVTAKLQECPLDICLQCNGIWFDPGEVERLKHLFPPNSAVVDSQNGDPRSKGPPPRWEPATIVVETILAILSS